MNEIVRDGGNKSRKLWFSVFSIVTIALGGVAAAVWPAFLPVYETFVGGVVAISGLYLAGNVTQKLIGSKVPATPAAPKKVVLKVEKDEEPPTPPAPRFDED